MEWLQDLPRVWEKGENFAFDIFDSTSGQFLGAVGLTTSIEPIAWPILVIGPGQIERGREW
jgi:hypothetical protein